MMILNGCHELCSDKEILPHFQNQKQAFIGSVMVILVFHQTSMQYISSEFSMVFWIFWQHTNPIWKFWMAVMYGAAIKKNYLIFQNQKQAFIGWVMVILVFHQTSMQHISSEFSMVFWLFWHHTNQLWTLWMAVVFCSSILEYYLIFPNQNQAFIGSVMVILVFHQTSMQYISSEFSNVVWIF